MSLSTIIIRYNSPLTEVMMEVVDVSGQVIKAVAKLRRTLECDGAYAR